MAGGVEVTEEREWSTTDSSLFDDPLLDYFAGYMRCSTARTLLSFAKVHLSGELIGVAPLVRLVRYRMTRFLKDGSRRWVDPMLGPFARTTACLIDTSFMCYRYREPFFSLDPAHAATVREAVVKYLKTETGIDALFLSEPLRSADWHRAAGFTPFLQLPLVKTTVSGCRNLDDYLRQVGRKRRKNLLADRRVFEKSGAVLDTYGPPLDKQLVGALHRLLIQSAEHNRASLEIPFDDVMNSATAFEMIQRHWVIVARVSGRIAGFFSFVPTDRVMHQCHGGLDYQLSSPIKAYPSLLFAAVQYAIENDFSEVTFGPLNNEAKRRAGTLAPLMSACWFRNPLYGFAMKRMLLRQLQNYTGPIT